MTPHPSKHTFSSGALGLILTRFIWDITTYSLNVPQPINVCSVWPSLECKRDVPSGIKPFSCIPMNWKQKFPFSCRQTGHCLHCGRYNGMTWSPAVKPVTPSPTDSTIPAPSWPRIIGKLAPTILLCQADASDWHYIWWLNKIHKNPLSMFIKRKSDDKIAILQVQAS